MERTTFTAGSTVRGGFYVNRDKLDLVVVGGKEGALPGEEGRYVRVPTAAALLVGPLLGGLFVAVEPCLGLVRLISRLRRSTLPQRLASIVGSWRRGEAARSVGDEAPPRDDAGASP